MLLSWRSPVAATFAACLSSSAALADPVIDKATGLSVTPPPNYTARSTAPQVGEAARVEVRTATDTDTGCKVAYTKAPRNNRFTQEQLNATMRGPDWQEAARTALSPVYDVKEVTVVDVNGRPAMVIAGDFKDHPGFPPRAKEVRTLLVIQETPKGRTSLACVGNQSDFASRRTEFMAVAGGVKGP